MEEKEMKERPEEILSGDRLPPLQEDLEELADLLAPRIDERLGELARRRRFG